MNRDARFDRGQLISLSSLILLSPALRLYPLLSARAAGRGAWLSALAALPPALALLWLLCRLLTARRDGEGLAELCLRALGDRAGRIVLGLLTLWLLLYGGFLLRAGADRFVEGLFPRAQAAPFSLCLGLLCLYAALGRPRALLRTAKLLLPVVLGLLLFVLLLSLRSADKNELLPLTAEDALPILAGGLPVVDVLSLCLLLPALLADGLRPSGRPFRAWALWLGGAALGLCALCAAVLGVFGAELTGRLSMPFFSLVRNLVFLRSFERMDALIISLWIFPDFLLVSALLFAAPRCLRLALGLGAAAEGSRFSPRGGRWTIWLCGGAVIVLSLLLAPDSAGLSRWSERIVPLCNLIVSFALTPTIYLAGKIRKAL